MVATSVASVITASAARAVADCGRRDHLNDYLDVVTLLNDTACYTCVCGKPHPAMISVLPGKLLSVCTENLIRID